MTTEAEAKTKWCPFGRIGHRDGIAMNDPANPNFSARCIGSDCMAWRWWNEDDPMRRIRVPFDYKESRSIEEPPRPADLPDSWAWFPADTEDAASGYWIEPAEEHEARFPGYCGLAGRPK